MDNLRGILGAIDYDADEQDYGFGDDEGPSELPPSPIGQDERRMQVRAYNHWASLLADRTYPSVEDLDPAELPDFGPNSILLDFTNGIDDPAVRFLGTVLAEECDVPTTIGKLSDVPTRSLLTRITDHYMQILANQAPIGFEAEFVNQRGQSIAYRGILLPFSSDDDTIDFIYGVINWKEVADQLTSDELLLEIDQALAAQSDPVATELPRAGGPVTDWADGPGADAQAALSDDRFPLPAFGNDDETADEFDEEDEYDRSDLYEAIEAVDEEPEGPSRFASLLTLGGGSASSFADDDEDDEDEGEDPVAKWLNRSTPLTALPEVGFGTDAAASGTPADMSDDAFDLDVFAEEPAEDEVLQPLDLDAFAAEADAEEVETLDLSAFSDAPFAVEAEPLELAEFANDVEPAPAVVEVAVEAEDAPHVAAALDANPAGDLYDCLAEARELAMVARTTEDRSRSALYAAVGRAYDVSLAAAAEPEEFAELMADSGLTMQDRAPMTPVVKLVFGVDYDKTRLTEYAAVLTHAHRVGIERGALADYLGKADGGLKGVVQAERALRRESDGDDAVRETPREALARKLRAIAPLGFEDIDSEGEEFALVMIRRVNGEVVVLGEIADVPLVEKAAKKLVA